MFVLYCQVVEAPAPAVVVAEPEPAKPEPEESTPAEPVPAEPVQKPEAPKPAEPAPATQNGSTEVCALLYILFCITLYLRSNIKPRYFTLSCSPITWQQ